MDILLDPTLYGAALRIATPILLAALAGMWCERIGVFNLALEGQILIGAFFGVFGSYFSGNALVGVLTAALAGALMGGIFAVSAVTAKAAPIVVGVALNALAVGLTAFLLAEVFGTAGTFRSDKIIGLDQYTVPVLHQIPWFGTVLFTGHTIIIYFAIAMAVLSWLVMFKTPVGLRLRGLGEEPHAAISLGVNVSRYQYVTLIVAGALCGIAGAQLSLGSVVLFTEGMQAGRGWLALVAMMLGAGSPVVTTFGAFLFGFVDSLGFRLQGAGVPSELTGALPFVVTLVVLAIAGRRALVLIRKGTRSLKSNNTEHNKKESGPDVTGLALADKK